MDFFQKQEQARRKTWLLILYFVTAVLCVVAIINVAAYIFLSLLNPYATSLSFNGWVLSDDSIAISLITVTIILMGTAYRTLDLVKGGIAVAEMVGAKLLRSNALDAKEKVFINVVEEMAIASGMPVPVLYVMEKEYSINAFVAGYQPTETVLVVTRGTLEQLTRDEIQGVVGHEFSHILNGDMRINMRLIAVLEGLLLIGKVGEFLFRFDSRDKRSGALPMVIGGLILYLVGYAGLFMGRVIKATLSRQREYLADASAVQFTRNAKGLAGALYKIKSSAYGSRLTSFHAEDLSHMCIGSVLRVDGWLATHPPLDDRINAIDQAYIGTQRAKEIIGRRVVEKSQSKSMYVSHSRAEVVASVGDFSAQQLAAAGQIYSAIPDMLLHALHEPEGAEYVIYALLSADNMPENIQRKVNGCRVLTDGLDRRLRLPIIDIALPQIKQLSSDKRQSFVNTVEAVLKADNRYTLNEFTIFTIIQQSLSDKSGRADVVRYHSFKSLKGELRLLMSMMVLCSGQSQQRKSDMYRRATRVFINEELPLYEEAVKPSEISDALERIRKSSMPLRKIFIEVCVDIVMDDGIIMPAEAELLRAICESIDCPMPLLVINV